MRRLVLIVTCIAVLGAGAAVWISGASATVAQKPALRVPFGLLKPLSPLLRRAPTLRAVPVPPTCYVAGGGCSLHPCVEFAASSAAVYQVAVPGIALASPRPAARSKCRPAASQVQRVGAEIVTAQPVK